MALSLFKNEKIIFEKNDVLILCSDGMTDGLDEAEIVEIIDQHNLVFCFEVVLTFFLCSMSMLQIISEPVICSGCNLYEIFLRTDYLLYSHKSFPCHVI